MDPGDPLQKLPLFPTRFCRGFASKLPKSFWKKKNQLSTFSLQDSDFFLEHRKRSCLCHFGDFANGPAQPFCLKRLGTKYSNFRVSAHGGQKVSTSETRAIATPVFWGTPFPPLANLPQGKGPEAASHAPLALWPRPQMCCVTPHSTLKGISKGGKASQILPSNFVTSSTLGRKEMAGCFFQSNQNLMRWKSFFFEAAIFWLVSLYVREIDRLHTCTYTSMCIYSVYVYTYVYIVFHTESERESEAMMHMFFRLRGHSIGF